jgi:chemotaxis protein CheX
MQSLRQHIEAIAAMVLETTAGVALVPAAGEIPRDRPALTGCVHIDGAWNGAALVECELPLARRLTAALFAREPADLALDEVRDALGEITNMVGGNLKALLPSPSRLSLPTVVEGADYAVTVPGTAPAAVASFRVGEQIVVVRVLEAVDVPVRVGR